MTVATRSTMKPANERRSGVADERASDDKWRTALTCIEPNKILVRGYPLDEMMGRLTFGESIYLLLMGEVPSPAIGSLMEAMLVSFIDHGATPPSTLAARNTATTGAPLRACVAAGVLGFGRYHGGDIESCMQFLDKGLERSRRRRATWRPRRRSSRAACRERRGDPGVRPPLPHARSARGAALPDGPRARGRRGSRADDPRRRDGAGNGTPGAPLPVNIDGAIAAVCGDLGIPPEAANALFIISRVPASRRTRARSASATSRCGRSIRRTTATTAPRSGACPSGASKLD
jgi:hypothetical protein